MIRERLKDYYHSHMDNKVLRQGLSAYRKIKRANKEIKVLFICQMPQLWNKIEDVYSEMRRDSQIKVFILVVPDVSVSLENQKESIEFFQRIEGTIINAKSGSDWYSVKELNPDYVFYQRPYDAYLPYEYRSSCVAQYARVCYIPYAYACTKPVEDSCYNFDFFVNVYMFFAENEYSREVIVEREKERYINKIKNAFYLGYPALDSIKKSKSLQGVYWKKDDKSYKILWCPRWTTEPKLGASHFFEYKDCLVEWVRKNKEYSMVFRPHPMMFSNFESTGQMTKKEAQQYLSNYMDNKRLMYDERPEYYSTLWNSDVLVADLTTVIIEYFVTRKPIIYFISEIEYNDFMKRIVSGCYCVKNKQELIEILKMLNRGEDPLTEERNKVADYLLKGKDEVAKSIVNKIKVDFYSGK